MPMYFQSTALHPLLPLPAKRKRNTSSYGGNIQTKCCDRSSKYSASQNGVNYHALGQKFFSSSIQTEIGTRGNTKARKEKTQ